MAKKEQKETPLMKQFNEIKGKHPDALLLFRVGDFYELFGQDAVEAAKILGIVQTYRKNGSAGKVELAGFPHHSIETYLPKLVRAGKRVAICDQLEDPKLTKTIVKRGVTELVTPGVSYNDKVLESKSNNFLASVHITKNSTGVAFLDISTGEFLCAEGSFEYVDKLLQSFQPTEVLYQRGKNEEFNKHFGESYYTFKLDEWVYDYDRCYEVLVKHFKTNSLKGFGIEDIENAIIAAASAMQYLDQTQHDKTDHISKISRIIQDEFVWLDRFTIRNLELINSQNGLGNSLLNVMDNTLTPMGGRLLNRYVILPLVNIDKINSRLDMVEGLINNDEVMDELSVLLSSVGDIERLVSKIATGRINPRELVYLNKSLQLIEPISTACSNLKSKEFDNFNKKFQETQNVINLILEYIVEEPPVAIGKGVTINSGINEELDKLRNLSTSGKDYLNELVAREQEKTGIPSLKVDFNNVFGYYLEVRNTHKDKVPEDWNRKQTLANAERYITEELKTYESQILGAEEKILQLESKIYQGLISKLLEYVVTIQHNSSLIAHLDCILNFATISVKYNYSRPVLDDGKDLIIVEGRHPVIESQLSSTDEFIPNTIRLTPEDEQIIMITGPNMSGKSAILRQTALITLMAQMGCFVPAKSANIGIVDKVFTRVGASDNISGGESTFMVEMNETASILNNISERSLVLLDEIGRGTSTYDGISIAWSITEYLHENNLAKPKTLFATHYHELNEMTNIFKRIKNYNVSVKELKNKVLFMRKLIPGGSHHSFGIHVAKMAGMPPQVIQRANMVLKELEKSHSREANTTAVTSTVKDDMQLSIFQLDDPVLEQIKQDILATDINTLTPVEALMKLNEIKGIVGG